jgi:chromosome segregation ATPase
VRGASARDMSLQIAEKADSLETAQTTIESVTAQLEGVRADAEARRSRDQLSLENTRAELKTAQLSLHDAETLLAKSERARLAARGEIEAKEEELDRMAGLQQHCMQLEAQLHEVEVASHTYREKLAVATAEAVRQLS